MRYITKGDANPEVDDNFITNEDIKGVVKFRVQYFGYPSLWARDLFKSNSEKVNM